jgi:hypothetical protein
VVVVLAVVAEQQPCPQARFSLLHVPKLLAQGAAQAPNFFWRKLARKKAKASKLFRIQRFSILAVHAIATT